MGHCQRRGGYSQGLQRNPPAGAPLLDGRLYAVVVTPRGEDLRVISFRKANRKETERYGKENR
jgi:uncharacterized DUF497 family protein